MLARHARIATASLTHWLTHHAARATNTHQQYRDMHAQWLPTSKAASECRQRGSARRRARCEAETSPARCSWLLLLPAVAAAVPEAGSSKELQHALGHARQPWLLRRVHDRTRCTSCHTRREEWPLSGAVSAPGVLSGAVGLGGATAACRSISCSLPCLHHAAIERQNDHDRGAAALTQKW